MTTFRLPPELTAALAGLGGTVQGATPVSGGMINFAARVETDQGPLFVKWHPNAPEGMYRAEADGLAALAATETVQVPQVLVASDAPGFLAMEYLPVAPSRGSDRFARRLGEQIAALHQTTAQAEEPCGFGSDNFIGVEPQANLPRLERWATFLRDQRLLPQIARAKALRRLTPERERLLDWVLNRLEDLLDELPPETSLLHGDLWSGNVLHLTGEVPAVVDPAVYYGPREMEIAFAELFGGFPDGWLRHYRHSWPLPHGYEARRPLHQLYPLLVHLNHFGAGYGPMVERACRAALK